MNARRPAGVLAAITTPFDSATGDVALGPLQRNAATLLASGLDGIVACGSTGEAPALEPDEQRRVVGALRQLVPERCWLIAGGGAESTRQAAALAAAAAREGADAILVRPPAYFAAATTPATLRDYYRAIADASPVPILVYNIPKYTHLSLEPGMLEELASHENIVGVKDSSGDRTGLAAYRDAVPRWSVLVGSGSLFSAALELGCNGAVLGVACFVPALCAEIYAAFQSGERARAGPLQQRLELLHQEIVGRLGPAGVKVAMDAVGLYGGPCRAPLAPLLPAERARVARLLAA